jgi:hypothetical protein
MQILRALVYPSYRGWKNHPATAMWRGFVAALTAYGLAMCAEWEWRGRADAVAASLLEFTGGVAPDLDDLGRDGRLPPWLGDAAFHRSHRSALVRKLPEHYRAYFPDAPDDLPYVWPGSVFPRWPVRRNEALTFDDALAAIGWTDSRPGQREAVAQLLDGHDVSLRWSAGAGATATGLIAALCIDGPTVWLHAQPEGRDDKSPSVKSLRRPPTPVRATRTSASIARPPTVEDRRAVFDEWSRSPEIRFYSPAGLRRHRREVTSSDAGLVVADGVVRPPRVNGAPILRIV